MCLQCSFTTNQKFQFCLVCESIYRWSIHQSSDVSMLLTPQHQHVAQFNTTTEHAQHKSNCVRTFEHMSSPWRFLAIDPATWFRRPSVADSFPILVVVTVVSIDCPTFSQLGTAVILMQFLIIIVILHTFDLPAVNPKHVHSQKDFCGMGRKLVGFKDTNCYRVMMRHFKAHFGTEPDYITIAWALVAGSGYLNQLGPRSLNPEHMLWTFMFTFLSDRRRKCCRVQSRWENFSQMDVVLHWWDCWAWKPRGGCHHCAQCSFILALSIW